MSFVFILSVWLAQSIVPLTEALSPDGKTLAFWWADKDFKKNGLFTRSDVPARPVAPGVVLIHKLLNP